MKLFATITLLTLLSPAFALDTACGPLVKSSEAKLAQPAWHAVVESAGLKLESIKIDGQFFMADEGKWTKAPMSLDAAEKIAIKQIQDGVIKVTDCQDAGTETVDGMEMTILSYTTEVPGSGFPAANTRLYIGKADGLPYQSSSEDTTATYRYTNVVAPKL